MGGEQKHWEMSDRRALLFLVPATAWVAFPFSSSFDVPKSVVAGCVLALLVIVAGRVKTWAWDWVDLAAGAYLLLSIPAYVRGGFVLEALVQLHMDLAGWLCFVLIRRVEPPLEGLSPARWLAAAGAGVMAFLFLERWWPAWPKLGALEGAATLGNPDLVAEFAAFALPATVAVLISTGRNRRWSALGWPLALVGLLAALVTLSSATAWVASGTGVLVLGCAALWPRLSVRWHKAALLVSAVVSLGVLVTAVGFSDQGRGRMYLYRLSGGLALEQPVSGVGAGGFGAAFMEAQGRHLSDHREDSGLWTNARHAHNQFVHLWVERGILPVLALLCLVALAFARGVKRRQGWVLATLAASLALFSGSITFDLAPVRLGFYMLLGLCVGTPGPREARPGRRYWAFALPIVLYLAVFPVWRGLGDLLFTQGWHEQSLAVNPLDGRARFYRGLELVEKGELQAGCNELELSAAVYPNLTTLLALGNCNLKLNAWERSEQWYRKAVAWKPTYSLAFANLAVLYREQGRLEESARHIIRAVSLNPGNQRIRLIQDQVCRDNRFCR